MATTMQYYIRNFKMVKMVSLCPPLLLASPPFFILSDLEGLGTRQTCTTLSLKYLHVTIAISEAGLKLDSQLMGGGLRSFDLCFVMFMYTCIIHELVICTLK